MSQWPLYPSVIYINNQWKQVKETLKRHHKKTNIGTSKKETLNILEKYIRSITVKHSVYTLFIQIVGNISEKFVKIERSKTSKQK